MKYFFAFLIFFFSSLAIAHNVHSLEHKRTTRLKEITEILYGLGLVVVFAQGARFGQELTRD